MALVEAPGRLLGLAKTVYRWLEAVAELDRPRRERVAHFAEKIADTIKRAADTAERLRDNPADKAAARQERTELGRIVGYLETLVDVLEDHLDGRKLAGVKRRLDALTLAAAPRGATGQVSVERDRAGQLAEAEGYFRALADGLRV